MIEVSALAGHNIEYYKLQGTDRHQWIRRLKIRNSYSKEGYQFEFCICTRKNGISYNKEFYWILKLHHTNIEYQQVRMNFKS